MTKRVLLIIDNDVQTLLISHLFADEFPNIEFLTAASGEDSLEILKSKFIDLILLDLLLPKMHGLDLIKHISQNPRPAIIVISGGDSPNTEIQAQLIGTDVFIAKPFDFSFLASLIKSTLIEYN